MTGMYVLYASVMETADLKMKTNFYSTQISTQPKFLLSPSHIFNDKSVYFTYYNGLRLHRTSQGIEKMSVVLKLFRNQLHMSVQSYVLQNLEIGWMQTAVHCKPDSLLAQSTVQGSCAKFENFCFHDISLNFMIKYGIFMTHSHRIGNILAMNSLLSS